MKKFNSIDLAVIVLWLLPIAYLLSIYSKLPATVPIHFGINGKPNGFAPRGQVWLVQGMVSGVSLAMYLLLKYLPAIDPKRQVKYGENTFWKFSLIIIGFLSAMSLVINHGILNNGFRSDNIIYVLISIMLVFMGNMMYSVKPNYFVGIRVPWTLENEDNWRATHRLAGKLWVSGGLLLTALMLILHGNAAFTVFISVVFLLTIIPTVYSYRYFKQHKAG